MESQSIFVKYQIWHERMSKFSELSCMSFDNEKMNRIKAIYWSLINTITSIENGQKTAFDLIKTKRMELFLLKTEDGLYVNNGIEWVNKQLLSFIDEAAQNDTYPDFKELLMFAFDISAKSFVH